MAAHRRPAWTGGGCGDDHGPVFPADERPGDGLAPDDVVAEEGESGVAAAGAPDGVAGVSGVGVAGDDVDGGDKGPKDRSAVMAFLAAVLLAAAAALEVVALALRQSPGQLPLSHDGPTVASHVVIAAGLLVSAGLCAVRSRGLVVAGAMIAAGIVAANLGNVISDFGTVLAVTTASGGLWTEAGVLVLGAVGAIVGLAGSTSAGSSSAGSSSAGQALEPSVAWTPIGEPGRRGFDGRRLPAVGLAVWTGIASVVLGVAFLPAWDRYHFVFVTVGTSRNVFAGSAFMRGTPGLTTAGDIVAALALALLPVVAILWPRPRAGVPLGLGVVIVVVAQTISAVAGIFHVPLSQFVSARTATEFGVVLHVSLTGWFDLEVVAGLALLVLLASRWEALAPDDDAAPVPPLPSGSTGWNPPGSAGWNPPGSAGWNPPGRVGHHDAWVSQPPPPGGR